MTRVSFIYGYFRWIALIITKESVVKQSRVPSVCKTLPLSILQFYLICKAVLKDVSNSSCRPECFNLTEFLKGCIFLEWIR